MIDEGDESEVEDEGVDVAAAVFDEWELMEKKFDKNKWEENASHISHVIN